MVSFIPGNTFLLCCKLYWTCNGIWKALSIFWPWVHSEAHFLFHWSKWIYYDPRVSHHLHAGRTKELIHARIHIYLRTDMNKKKTSAVFKKCMPAPKPSSIFRRYAVLLLFVIYIYFYRKCLRVDLWHGLVRMRSLESSNQRGVMGGGVICGVLMGAGLSVAFRWGRGYLWCSDGGGVICGVLMGAGLSVVFRLGAGLSMVFRLGGGCILCSWAR